MTIPDYRLKATDKTVMKFREVPAGSPEALRAWFYRAAQSAKRSSTEAPRLQLAKASKVAVPAHAVDVVDDEVLKTVAIVASRRREGSPVVAVIQTTPIEASQLLRARDRTAEDGQQAADLYYAGFASLALAFAFSRSAARGRPLDS